MQGVPNRKRGRPRNPKSFVVHPWSLDKMPSAAELVAAWEKRQESQKDFIAFLSVLGELACFLDYDLEQKGGFGNIGGRKGGLKEYLETRVPKLAAKYKSLSRYMSLVKRFKRAFNYYPPAKLAFLHPDLEPPGEYLPFIVNYAKKIYCKYLQDLPPEYNAFNEVVKKRFLEPDAERHRWGLALPRKDWPKAQRSWQLKVVLPAIVALHRFDRRFRSLEY